MRPQSIQLYNTKTRTLEHFKPIKEGNVGIYSCGPTVYHHQHLGNMRAVVFADTLRRMFLYAGYTVKHVINITDVGHLVSDGDNGEDKMEKGAKREGKNVWEIAKMYTDEYFKDLISLNVPIENFIFPRATDNIDEQIGLISALEIASHTYQTSDGVYFDTSTFPTYKDFAQLDVEGLKSGARVEENTEKRNITDFALWKFSPKNETRQMEWKSPWGIGFPGWHIECSAMSMKYLGEHFDLHTGGIEHIQVHHTNEIAQSECVTGATSVNYWMHNNHLQDKTGKMSKSSGDFLTITTLKEKNYSPLSYRYFLMTAQYRNELAFSFENLDGAVQAHNKLLTWCSLHITQLGNISEKHKTLFEEALYNDLNTPQALAVIWTLLKDDTVSSEDKYATLLSFDQVLGIGLSEAKKETIEISDDIKELLEARKSARANNDYKESDRLREEITKLGFSIKDGKEGQEITKN